MSTVLIALFFGAGAAAWVYAKVSRTTGGNTQQSAIVAAIVGVLAFLAFLTLLNMIPN